MELGEQIANRASTLTEGGCWVDREALAECFICPNIDCYDCFAQYGVLQTLVSRQCKECHKGMVSETGRGSDGFERCETCNGTGQQMKLELEREEVLCCVMALENKKKLYPWEKSALTKLLKAMKLKPIAKQAECQQQEVILGCCGRPESECRCRE